MARQEEECDVLVVGAGEAAMGAEEAVRSAGRSVLRVVPEARGDQRIAGVPLRAERVVGLDCGGFLRRRSLRAAFTIDATDDGEVVALAGLPVRRGPEIRRLTGEPSAPENVPARSADGPARLVGADLLTERDLRPAQGGVRPRLSDVAIAAGGAVDWPEPGCVPFQIGYGCLLPREAEGLLACGRALSATYLAKPALEDPELRRRTGIAAGTAAALAAASGVEARFVNVDRLRRALVEQGVPLFAYVDVPPGHPAFEAAQTLAAWGDIDAREPLELRPDAELDEPGVAELADRSVRAFQKSPARLRACFRPGMSRGEFLIACAAISPS